MSECNHDCNSCSEACESRENSHDSFLAEENTLSHIKRIIAVVSGKGGVGKSLVTCMLATAMRKKGYSVGVLDADITGPSMPKAFGLASGIEADDFGMYPSETALGTRVMSLNLLLDGDTEPVIWRGPIIAGTVKQFYTNVVWGDVDFMFVDMPPGTGDVPLTVFQSLPIAGVVIVTTPQELVSMIVEKAVNMANKMNVPVLGIVENMSYFSCPDCGKRHNIFGESRIDVLLKRHRVTTAAELPIDPAIAKLTDEGRIEECDVSKLEGLCAVLERIPARKEGK